MQIEAQGLIYDTRGRPASEQVAFFPSLCPLRNGTILAGFQLGSRKHAVDSTIRLCQSDDAGTTWRELPARFETTWQGIPGSLSAPELVEVEPDRLLLFATWFDRSDPTRPLFDPQTEGILRSRLLLTCSCDAGQTWAPWTNLSTAGRTGCASTGPVLLWPDGSLAYAFESFKEFDDLSPARHAACLLVSRDGGRSFTPPLLLAEDPEHHCYYWDQRLCLDTDDGAWVAMFWTHDRKQRRDLPVHLLRGRILGSSIVQASPRPTSLPGQIAAPLFLPDRRLLAFVVQRDPVCTLTLWVSSDEGQTWPPRDALLIYAHQERAVLSQGPEDIDFKQYWEDMGKWSFGHPAIRLLSPTQVLLAWYAGTPEQMSVHWARVRVTASDSPPTRSIAAGAL